LALSGSGGFRLAEVSLVDGTDFTAMKMPRASLFFIIKGVVKRCPSAQELSNMKPGEDRVDVLACAAKNDPLVLNFLPSPIIVGFNSKDPEDAGLILRDLALHCPCPSTIVKNEKHPIIHIFSWWEGTGVQLPQRSLQDITTADPPSCQRGTLLVALL
jgi:hypothetical protein